MKLHVKFWLAAAAVILGAFLIFQWNATHFHLGSWLQVHTGTVNEPGPYYGFFSGFGSDLGEYAILTSIASGIILTARRHNCHVTGCLWIGRYEVAGGTYKVCGKHHPDPAVRDKHVTREHVTLAHRKHLEDRGINPGG